ncbi:DeoR/GlpR transcriptional regulator [Limnobaculum zhutongyuii]|uniref:DeoR/GlpR transcriptional regulator n=1 Tax=Limnobaculum zhutongyuii TaxID=2498113 RepID=A0A411WKF9_9GAMM|nr:DeoR/GlpR family DNA-binding transcription regulator [Limnobaculum zhutongyuii]QBH96648.1 DeoR/GlpR transcriptional regulator [Limnobaculum zhutongyuii]TQS90320.1 DeoR/GlpR transcriptional regulator [Limnobaculum zhutongyuii]
MAEGRSSNFRHQTILEQLSSNGQVFVHDLAEYFNVAQETIRRDLTKLESQKLLKKVHGGAVNIQSKFERNFSERAKVAIDEKKAIAVKAAGVIKSGDTLFIDFGSTTVEFSQSVKMINNLTVITNSPVIASIMQENPTIETILIGGQFIGSQYACLGAIALRNISELFADYAVIGVGAIDVNRGIMDQNVDEAAVARKMLENSDKLIALADSSKVNKHAINLVTGWEDVDILVTTSKDFKIADKRSAIKTKIILASTGSDAE